LSKLKNVVKVTSKYKLKRRNKKISKQETKVKTYWDIFLKKKA
jgi:hypothetical protein